MIGQTFRLIWPGGEHDFRLAIGELRALEQRRDCGCFIILARLYKGECMVDDVIEVLRIGLIGGGMSEKQAMLTIQKSYDHANIIELATTATHVLAKFIQWKTGDDVDVPPEDKKSGEEMATTNSSPSPTEDTDGRATSAPLQ
jgi:hypothetical protein